MNKLQPSRLYAHIVFLILKKKTHENFGVFSAQPTSSYLEPWQSWLTIQGTHNVFAAGLIFKHSVNPTSFLEICLHLISVLFLFTETPVRHE